MAESLRRLLRTANPLPPVDLALRSLLRIGVLQGHLIAPPLAAPSWEQDATSTIQTEASQEARRSQRAHLLLRILAARRAPARWCADRLAELYDVRHTLTDQAQAEEFVAFFDTLQPRMVSF